MMINSNRNILKIYTSLTDKELAQERISGVL